MRLIHLLIKESEGKGRGVFSTEPIEKDGIIEICPIIKIEKGHLNCIDQTNLYNYYFLWDQKHIAIALGFGSIYNHDNQPNAAYNFQKATDSIIFKALKKINPNEEILVDYTDGSNKVWWKKNIRI